MERGRSASEKTATLECPSRAVRVSSAQRFRLDWQQVLSGTNSRRSPDPVLPNVIYEVCPAASRQDPKPPGGSCLKMTREVALHRRFKEAYGLEGVHCVCMALQRQVGRMYQSCMFCIRSTCSRSNDDFFHSASKPLSCRIYHTEASGSTEAACS